MVQRLYVLTGDTPGTSNNCAAASLGAVDANGAAVTGLKYDGAGGACDAGGAGGRGRPVEFEQEDAADPFGLDEFLDEAGKGNK